MRRDPRIFPASIALILVSCFAAGCASSIYGWQVRTNSTPRSETFQLSILERQPVALFPSKTSPGLRGNEVGLSQYLGEVLRKIVPSWKVISAKETITRINRQGLASEFIRIGNDYEQSDIFERDPLRKIAAGIGARYVFQPRLATFTQMMIDRFKFPGIDLRLTQTRSSIMRLSLQLWNAETGELVWDSVAETNMANEAVSQDPVYLEDIARATLASMISDLLHGRTSSQYTTLDKVLDNLIEDAMPKPKDKTEETSETVAP
jgi:hypothetical protein